MFSPPGQSTSPLPSPQGFAGLEGEEVGGGAAGGKGASKISSRSVNALGLPSAVEHWGGVRNVVCRGLE